MRATSVRSWMVVLGVSSSLAAAGGVLATVALFREVHDWLGPEVEYLLGNESYPCRALPPTSGVMAWIVFGLFVVPVAAVVVALAALSWHGFANARARSGKGRPFSGSVVLACFLASIAVVAVVLAADFTFLWTQYAEAGPHGQTPLCPPTNGEWRSGQAILVAIALGAVIAAVLVAWKARRARMSCPGNDSAPAEASP